MPPSYTVTTGDVASVAADSKLTAGTVFDWGSQTITIPASTSVVDAQWLADAARFAEMTTIGYARPNIVSPQGKYKKGVDPATGLDLLAGVEVILLDQWIIRTAKTSGFFVVRDIYKVDGGYPIAPNPLVNLQYQTAQGVSLVQLAASGGGGDGFTNTDRAVLTATRAIVEDIADFSGYTEGEPMTADATAGTVTANGKTVTVTQPTPTTKVYSRD